jgi:putative DNA primase/helicase
MSGADTAHVYAAAGLAVFPCDRDKTPLTEHGFHDATTDAALISAWWRRFPAALIGVAIPAGHVVVDVDGPQGWAALEAEGLTLPATLTAITGRGEWHRHLWYRLPDGVTVGCVRGLLAGVDTRALGGYVIMPPSRSTFGPYTWQGGFDLDRIAPAPDWLLERCAPARPPGQARPVGEWVTLLRGPVPEGHRHETLLRVAGLLLRRHDATVAVELARAWHDARCVPPLPEGEAERILRDAVRLEARRFAGGAR